MTDQRIFLRVELFKVELFVRPKMIRFQTSSLKVIGELFYSRIFSSFLLLSSHEGINDAIFPNEQVLLDISTLGIIRNQLV